MILHIIFRTTISLITVSLIFFGLSSILSKNNDKLKLILLNIIYFALSLFITYSYLKIFIRTLKSQIYINLNMSQLIKNKVIFATLVVYLLLTVGFCYLLYSDNTAIQIYPFRNTVGKYMYLKHKNKKKNFSENTLKISELLRLDVDLIDKMYGDANKENSENTVIENKVTNLISVICYCIFLNVLIMIYAVNLFKFN